MYQNMWDVVRDLEKNNQLLRIKTELDPNLEVAEVHRQVYDKQGPAILFENIKGSPYPALSNLYGTIDRTEFLFRKTLPKIKRVIELKADPTKLLKNPFRYLTTPLTALQALPMHSWFGSPVKYSKTTIDQLPQIKSWPMDGGAFVTLPQVFTLPPGSKNPMESNLGMYRIQLSGNDFKQNEEIGLHYQLHRGIGVHHEAYNRSEEPFRCSIFVGGLPSHAFSAIMPMPEGISELTFAGMLGGKRFRYSFDDQGHFLSSDADFVITGTILKNVKKPEGPFGDHLGYYSLTHDFPVMKVDSVYHRKNPIWHFTVVGRPPQEDSSFGYLIHKLVEDLTEQEFPGVKEIHAVDAAGVHPLLIAIGQERYMPFRDPKPEEILTIANRIIGSGQTSLAKYLIIAAFGDDVALTTHNLKAFFQHFLERVDWTRDLHFQTKTTIDTLDYSGDDWNGGSKVVMACRGLPIRKLEYNMPAMTPNSMINSINLIMPGVLGISLKPFTNYLDNEEDMKVLTSYLSDQNLSGFPLVVISDNSQFTSKNMDNFVWVTFTRSNPSHDIYGVGSFVSHKHWGCKGSLIIDARKKPHHAPELVADTAIQKKVAEWLNF
ncbi:MAG: UbiD family decarboxylase [Saprospiraceae bacterium]|nr:UbiD family decarboxylase [Saprospiraceae bacterium]